MTEVYHTTEFADIKYNTDDKILIVTFLPYDKYNDLDFEDKLKEFFKKYLEAFLHYKTSKVLFDYRNFNSIIGENLTKWVTENIVKITVSNGLKKLAQIYPHELYSKLDLDYIVQPIISNVSGPVRMIFEDYETAYKWLLKD